MSTLQNELQKKIVQAITQGEVDHAYNLLKDIAGTSDSETYDNSVKEVILCPYEAERNSFLMARSEQKPVKKKLSEEEGCIEFIRDMLFRVLRGNIKDSKIRGEMMECFLQLPVFQDIAASRDPEAFKFYNDCVELGQPITSDMILSTKFNGPLRYTVRNRLEAPVKYLLGVPAVKEALFKRKDRNGRPYSPEYSILVEALLALGNYAPGKLNEAKCVCLLLKAYLNEDVPMKDILAGLLQEKLPIMDSRRVLSNVALSAAQSHNIREWISKLSPLLISSTAAAQASKLPGAVPGLGALVLRLGALVLREEGRGEEMGQAPTSGPEPARPDVSSTVSSSSSTTRSTGEVAVAVPPPFLPSRPTKQTRDEDSENQGLSASAQSPAAAGEGSSGSEDEQLEGGRKKTKGAKKK